MRSSFRDAVAASRNTGDPRVALSQRQSQSGFLRAQTGAEAYLHAMEVSGDVYSLVTLIASSAAKVNWHLYRKQVDGRRRYNTADVGDDQRTEVTRHAALDLWKRPNAFMTPRVFVNGYQQHMELAGEGYWVFQTAGSQHLPINMFYVRPDRMEPVPDPVKFLAGYVYTAPSGEQVPLETWEVIGPPSLVMAPHPTNMYHGIGPVQSVLGDIRNSQYATQWNTSWFMNSASPGGTISVAGKWDDTEFDEWAARYRETHRGVAAAGRVAILEGGATWTPDAVTQKDMQFIEGRNLSWENTRRAWRVHPQMTGDVADVNRANAETAEETFTRWIISDRLDITKDVLNGPYLEMFGAQDSVEFDYDDPTPDNRTLDNNELTAKVAAFVALVGKGVDPDSAAETVGLPNMKMSEPDPVPAAIAAPDAPAAIEPASTPAELEQASIANAFRQLADKELTEMAHVFGSLNGVAH